MQNSIAHYNSKPVRIIERQNQLWFLATDICRALDIYKLPNGYVSSTNATYSLKYNEEKCTFIGALSNAHQKLTFVNEQGLYKMVNNSGMYMNNAVKDWVEKLVRPTISQSIAQPQLTDDEIILKAITILQNRLKQATGEQDGSIDSIMPKVPKVLRVSKPAKSELQWLTVNEWCERNKINLELGERFSLGRRVANICKREGINYKKKSVQYRRAKDCTYKGNAKIFPEHAIVQAAEILGIKLNKASNIAYLNAAE